MSDEMKDKARSMRIKALKQAVKQVTGNEEPITFSGDEPTSPVHEQFLEQVLEYEMSPDTTGAAILAEGGLEVPPSATLADKELSEKLWEQLEYMGQRSIFVMHTDHLSDRELYRFLETEFAGGSIKDFGAMGGWFTYDLISSGSDEDNDIYLRHYATVKARADWQRDYPDESIPPMEAPPYDRDRDLPRGPHDGEFLEYDSRRLH